MITCCTYVAKNSKLLKTSQLLASLLIVALSACELKVNGAKSDPALDAGSKTPKADAQAFSVNEDEAFVFNLSSLDKSNGNSANDSSKAADKSQAVSLSYSVVDSPLHGTISGTAPEFSYTPNANYNGADSFTYKVSNGKKDSEPALVSITVVAVNDAPLAAAQEVSANEDVAQAITLAASDIDGDALSFAIVSGPAHGSLGALSGAGVTYTPAVNFNGTDTFTYIVNDGHVDSAPATVSISVAAVNDAPVAIAQAVDAIEDAAQAIALDASDVEGDALSFSIVSAPEHGSLSAVSGAGVTYTPAADFNGSDSFTFKANDGHADSAPATVSVAVAAVNDVPVAVADSASVNEDAFIDVAVLSNDTDVDANTLSVASVGNPSHGTAVIQSDGSVRYTPTPLFHGSDSFSYQISDGAGGNSTSSVALTINHVNHVPVANALSVAAKSNLPVNFTVTGSDLDSADPALVFSVVTQPSHGILSGTAPNFSYQATAPFTGSDSFTFEAFDGTAYSVNATVTVTVSPALSFSATGISVDNSGKISTVGRSGNSIKLECLDSNFNSLATVQTINASADASLGTYGELIAKSKTSGVTAIIYRGQTASNDWNTMRRFLRIYDSNCQALSSLITVAQPGAGSNAMDYSDLAVGSSGKVYIADRSYYSNARHLTLQVYSSSGSLLGSLDTVPTGEYGAHIAVNETFGVGIVTTQGHSGSPSYFRRFNTSTLQWIDAGFLNTGSNQGSWYDSHDIAINDNGGFVIIQTNWSDGRMDAYFYNSSASQVAAKVLGYQGNGYDTFRGLNDEIQLLGSDFLLPWSSIGGYGGLNRLTRFSSNGTRRGADIKFSYSSANYFQLDSSNNSYALVGSNIVKNAFSLPDSSASPDPVPNIELKFADNVQSYGGSYNWGFNNSVVGDEPVPLAFAIRNFGSQPVTISGVSGLTHFQLSQDLDNVVIAAGATLNFEISSSTDTAEYFSEQLSFNIAPDMVVGDYKIDLYHNVVGSLNFDYAYESDVSGDGSFAQLGQDYNFSDRLLFRCLDASQNTIGDVHQVKAGTSQGSYSANVLMNKSNSYAAVIYTKWDSTDWSLQDRGVQRFDNNCGALNSTSLPNLVSANDSGYSYASINRAGLVAVTAARYDSNLSENIFNMELVSEAGDVENSLESNAPSGSSGATYPKVALAPIGNSAVFSTQSDWGSTWFKRFDISDGSWIDADYKDLSSDVSFGVGYSGTHYPAINDLGNVLIVQSDYDTGNILAVNYDPNGDFVSAPVIGTLSESWTAFGVFGTWVKPQFIGNDFLVPSMDQVTGYYGQSNSIVRISDSGGFVGAANVPNSNGFSFMMDDNGNHYLVDWPGYPTVNPLMLP